jgi:quercetin dioxygenase-like cupin family protein
MTPEEFQELAALNALGALNEADEALLRKQLEREPAPAKRELAELNDTAALAAAALTPAKSPPAALREKILNRVRSGKLTGNAGATGAAAEWSSAMLEGFKFLRAHEMGEWRALPVPGAYVKLLHMDVERGYAVALGKLDPGTRYPEHRHQGPEEIFILSGDLTIGGQRLDAGDFHHADAGTTHGVNFSETGCVILAVLTTADAQALLAGHA